MKSPQPSPTIHLNNYVTIILPRKLMQSILSIIGLNSAMVPAAAYLFILSAACLTFWAAFQDPLMFKDHKITTIMH